MYFLFDSNSIIIEKFKKQNNLNLLKNVLKNYIIIPKSILKSQSGQFLIYL